MKKFKRKPTQESRKFLNIPAVEFSEVNRMPSITQNEIDRAREKWTGTPTVQPSELAVSRNSISTLIPGPYIHIKGSL